MSKNANKKPFVVNEGPSCTLYNATITNNQVGVMNEQTAKAAAELALAIAANARAIEALAISLRPVVTNAPAFMIGDFNKKQGE